MQLHHHAPPPPPPPPGGDDDGSKGCTAKSAGDISCNWTQMATATCPVAGPGVIMPDNCRPQRILILM